MPAGRGLGGPQRKRSSGPEAVLPGHAAREAFERIPRAAAKRGDGPDHPGLVAAQEGADRQPAATVLGRVVRRARKQRRSKSGPGVVRRCPAARAKARVDSGFVGAETPGCRGQGRPGERARAGSACQEPAAAGGKSVSPQNTRPGLMSMPT